MKKILNLFLVVTFLASTQAYGTEQTSSVSKVQNAALKIVDEKKKEVEADLEKLDALDLLLASAQKKRNGSKVILTISTAGIVGASAFIIFGTAMTESTLSINNQLVSKSYSPIPLIIGGVLLATTLVIAVKNGYSLVITSAEYANLISQKESVRTKLEIKQRQLAILVQEISNNK